MDAPTTGPAHADASSDPPEPAAIIPTSKQQENPRHEEETTPTKSAAEEQPSLFSKAIQWSQSQWQQQSSTTTPSRSGSDRPRRHSPFRPSSSGSASPHRITPSTTPPPPTLAVYNTDDDNEVRYYSQRTTSRFDDRGHYSHRRLPAYSHDTTATFGFGFFTQPDINAAMSLLIAVAKAAQFTDAFLTGLLVPLIPTILETRAGVHHNHGMCVCDSKRSYCAFGGLVDIRLTSFSQYNFGPRSSSQHMVAHSLHYPVSHYESPTGRLHQLTTLFSFFSIRPLLNPPRPSSLGPPLRRSWSSSGLLCPPTIPLQLILPHPLPRPTRYRGRGDRES